MAQKKHYYYDKEQFVDKNGKLLFLMEKYPDEYNKDVYLMADIYNDQKIYYYLSELTPVLDTYKYFVDTMCEEMDFSHRSPTGFSKALRTIVIHRCLTESYKNIKKEYLPSVENLANVFNITYQAMLTADKKAYQSELSCV